MSSLTIRQATSSDKETVINIHNNVYDGLDYIAEYYDEFISCPLTTPYVALIDNKIVGFVATFIIDEGKTVITRAGRLSPTVGGQGLYKQFHAHVLCASGVSQHAFIIANAHPSVNKESFRSVNNLVLMKPLTRFMLDNRLLSTLDESPQVLLNPTDEDINFYFSELAVRRYLFPKERIIVDWVPFRLIEANIPLLRWSGKRTNVFSDVNIQADGQVKGLLTFSTIIPVKRPAYNCNLNIYGTDTTTLKRHVVSHIRHIRDVTDDVTCLLVFVEPSFDMHELEKVFREIGVEKKEWHDSEHPEITYSQQYLFEKAI